MILSKYFTGPAGLLAGVLITASSTLPLQAQSSGANPIDLTAFRQPTSGWETVGDVTVSWTNRTAMTTSSGSGIWAHVPKRKQKTDELVTVSSYGDVELEFDYLLASGSEATIYLNDAYPIVLSESGQLLTPHAAQRDGITGYAPRQLVSRAPGLWQRLRISFKAPEFGADGSKRAPARLLRAELNGVLIHEDVPLVAAQGKTEQAKAPLRIVVNNGPIAFRNAGIATLRQRDQQRGGGPDPILVNAPTNTILRSFMDIPGTRVVHAVSVGHPQRVHYTYDLDHGNVVQVWRGGFLDATPMWHDRGNGTSRVLGSPIIFGKPRLAVAKLNGSDTPWPTDTSGTGYKPKGYTLDREERPTFRYQLYGASVEDAWTPLAEGHGFSRTVTVTGSTDNLYLQLAAAPSITDQGNGVYLVGDKRWYVQLQDTGKEKPVIRDQGEIKELLVPIRSVIRYSIIF